MAKLDVDSLWEAMRLDKDGRPMLNIHSREENRFIAAVAAMEGLIAAPILPNVVYHTPEELCKNAVLIADALLAELDKKGADKELEEFAKESEIVE